MSEQGTGETGRWGDSELQEMELRLEAKLQEIVGGGLQWVVRQIDESVTDVRREMQGMREELQEIADRVCETNEKVGWLACRCAGQKRQFEQQLEQQMAAVVRMNEEMQRAAEGCGRGMRKVGDMMQGQMMKRVEVMMKDMGEQIVPHVRNGMEKVMGEHEDVVRSKHREMKGKLDELQAQLRRGFRMGSGGRDGEWKGKQMGDEMSDDSMSAAATVLVAAGGGMKEREGVREDQYGGGAQYFAGPPMQ